MKALLKNLGVLIVILGAAVLLVYHFSASQSNAYLWIGLGLEVLGLVAHIVLNKYIE